MRKACVQVAVLAFGCVSPSGEGASQHAVSDDNIAYDATQEDGPGSGSSTDIVPGDPEHCSPNGCGTNSPIVASAVVGGIAFSRLHSYHQPNPEQVSIAGVTHPRYHDEASLVLRVVDNDRLQLSVANGPVFSGDELIGTMVMLQTSSGRYQLSIDRVSREKFWIHPAAEIERYELRYRRVAADGVTYGESRPLCASDDDPASARQAYVFTGDLYEQDTKQITVGEGARDWMTIACASSAPYKMHRAGYTTAAQNRLGITTTLGERRSLLNAWTANVCGGGQAFTHAGEPITLRAAAHNGSSSFPYSASPATTEAIWRPNGAVCLNLPRLHEEDSALDESIAAAPGCNGVRPPPCTVEQIRNWRQYGDVITGNPKGE